VAGLGVRLLTDEMIDTALAPALRQRGYDVESCAEAGRANQKIPDADQLAYAALSGRAILTFNIADYYSLDAEWKELARAHRGIVVSVEIQDVGLLLRLVQDHLDHCASSVQHDTLLWLGSLTPPRAQ
jgi:hypothetical protein